jgi:class 3 adenylate cyclase
MQLLKMPFWQLRVNSIHLALLLERSVVRVSVNRDSALRPEANSQLHQIAGLVHDYHAFRLPFWRSTPMILVSSQVSQTEIAHLRDIFADPLSFDPTQSERMDRFYWPWQRCLSSSDRNEIRYRPIATTSLTLDVRASTSAMELTDPPDKFSEFIDAVVSGARSRILKHGGYFDKETGDGIIGHFCSHGNVPTSANNDLTAMEIVAVRAGQEIAQFVQDLSAEYQRWLRHGMNNLGAAIGIHTGTAVWLADEMQIRAIGSSVVGAARLCNCAEAGEIVVSNKTYHAVEEFHGTIAGLTFKKKQVSLQEYGERLGTYAYSARAIA